MTNEELIALRESPGFAYIAAPYTDEVKATTLGRVKIINSVCAALMKEGVHLFSPISHCHPIMKAGGLPGGFDFWGAYNRKMISHSEHFVVLELKGWKESDGVCGESKTAKGLHIPRIGISWEEICDRWLDLSLGL